MISARQNKILQEREDRRKKLLETLPSFTGSENFYSHPSGLVFTDGIRFLAETAKCWWLLDLIFVGQLRCLLDPKKERLLEHQFWKLTAKDDGSAVLECFYDEGDRAFWRPLRSTDFPLDSVDLWVSDGTLYLPSEH